MPKDTQARGWCFTIHQPTSEDIERLKSLPLRKGFKYLIFGMETGKSGITPHVQGYVEFTSARRFSSVKRMLVNRAHLEKRRGSPYQAAEYCKKEGEFQEFGELPVTSGGKRKLLPDWMEDDFRRLLDEANDKLEHFESGHPSCECTENSVCRSCISSLEYLQEEVDHLEKTCSQWPKGKKN